jgi:hypothetical protein
MSKFKVVTTLRMRKDGGTRQRCGDASLCLMSKLSIAVVVRMLSDPSFDGDIWIVREYLMLARALVSTNV